MTFLWLKLCKTDDDPPPTFERELSEFVCVTWWVHNFCRFQSDR